MKKILSCVMAVFVAVFLALPITVQAVDVSGLYVTPKIGASYGTMDNTNFHGSGLSDDNGWNFMSGLSVGYDFDKVLATPVRVELEYLNRFNTKVHDESIRSQTLFVNAFWDFHNDTAWTPYVFAGTGLAFFGDGTNWGANAGVGVSYAVTQDLSLDLSERYTYLGRGHHDGYRFTGKMIETTLGLRYTF